MTSPEKKRFLLNLDKRSFSTQKLYGRNDVLQGITTKLKKVSKSKSKETLYDEEYSDDPYSNKPEITNKPKNQTKSQSLKPGVKTKVPGSTGFDE